MGERDRRILLLTGMAAGIGSIFKAPLGGAIFAIEVLYMQDFGVEALIPCFVSAVVGFSVYSSIFGFAPIFQTPQHTFGNPLSLIFYAALGLLLALAAVIYIKIF